MKRFYLVALILMLTVTPSMLPAEPLCVTRSSYDFNRDGQMDSIAIWLMEGKRYNDTERWDGGGEKYEGEFSLVVEIAGQAPVIQRLNPLFSPGQEQSLFFWCDEPWELRFADYNHDGRMDFNLGQYFSGVANRYRLFTVSPAGVVSGLAVNTPGGGFTGPKARVHSVDAIKATSDGFICPHYSREAGTEVVDRYRWDAAKGLFLPVGMDCATDREERDDGC